MVNLTSNLALLGLGSSVFSLATAEVKKSIPNAMEDQSFAENDNGRYYLQNPNFSYWMDTKDDILSEFKNYMQQAEKRLGSTYSDTEQDRSLKTLQRFAELVDMIMYLQKVPFFGQYWYYGCWCAPEGFFNTARQGYGNPVDKIDKSCRSMSYCYECAQLDHGAECNTEEVSYRWHGSIENGKKVVHCDDEPGTCEHSLCSCDKNLAQDLAEHEDEWNLHNHHKWGEFNRDSCFISPEQAQVRDEFASKKNSVSAFETEATIGARSFGNLGEAVPAITLKFASAFANPEEKYCCGEYDSADRSLDKRRVPLKRYNTKGEPHNDRCCIKSDSNKLFSGQPYRINHGECCDSTTGAVGKLEEAAQCDA